MLILSSAALVLTLRLPSNLAQVFSAYFNLHFGAAAPVSNFFADWNAPFPAFGLVAWLVWLGAVLVLLKLKTADTSPLVRPHHFAPVNWKKLLLWLIAGLILGLVLLIAWWSRAAQLLPDATGQLTASNYDEMVYFTGADLWARGNWPYRDFLLAHPPGALLIIGTWLKMWGMDGGGREAFVVVRQLCVGLGVVTTAGVFWTAGRLWARPGQNFALLAGAGAAFVYAADGRASGVAVLETVSNFAAVLACGAFVETTRLPGQNRWHKILLVTAGFLAAAAFLAKLPGLAIFIALLIYLVWKNFRQWRNFGWLSTGFGVGLLLVGAIFVLKGGVGAFLRQVVFFQLLRPQEVRSGIDEIGRVSDYPEARLTIILGTLALIVLAFRSFRQRNQSDLWLILVIWSAPLLAVFILGKSFHPWYYVQLALPFALLTGGLFNFSFQTRSLRQPAPINLRLNLSYISSYKSYLWLCGLALLAAPAFLTEWDSSHAVSPEKTYQPVAEYIQTQKAKNDGQMLSFDPGFAFMSGLQPARLPDGKLLVDSAGYMVYLNLDIDRRNLLALLGDGLGANRARGQVDATFGLGRAQALVTEAMAAQRWTVLDVKLGLAQLTPQTVEFLQSASPQPPVSIGNNLVWQGRGSGRLREWGLGNGLQLFPMGLTLSVGNRANILTADDNDVLHLNPTQIKDGVLDLRLVWRVVKQPSQPGKLFVHLINSVGQTVAQSDLAPLQGHANIALWQPGDTYQDIHSLPVPPDLPPGRYTVQIGLYNPADGVRVLIEGQDSLTLGYLEFGTGR